jgi:basic membrane protein A and related proteins
MEWILTINSEIFHLYQFMTIRLSHRQAENIMLYSFAGHKKMIRSFLRLFSYAVIFSLLISLQSVAIAKELKVGFVYLSSAKDAGWSYAHELGRQIIEKMPGVTTTFVDSVIESDDNYIEAVLTRMARSGNDLIFATSYGYSNAVIKIARQYPKVIFMHCSGEMLGSNVGTYFGRIYQARYLTGLVAGAMTKSNVIGYVAAYPIPEVIRGINAFTLGVLESNPNANVLVRWTKDWNDPIKEKTYANKLVDLKADILAQHQDSPAVQVVAKKRGVYSIGYNHDMSPYAREAHLTAAIWNWNTFYKNTVKKVSAGNWKSEDTWWGLEKDLVDIAPFGPMVPDKLKLKVLRRKEEIKSQEFSVFSGPVLDRDGNTQIPKGKQATDEELRSMNWFVKGVIGDFDPN